MTKVKQFKGEETLTKQEGEYWRIIKAQYLVLNLKGRPMTAKSALGASIAKKLGLHLIDLRIPTMEEVDLGVYPKAVDELDRIEKIIRIEKDIHGKNKPETLQRFEEIAFGGKRLECLTHPIPQWAFQTMDKTKNFLIIFEEFNRAPLAVRNAAMGVMLERRVGFEFEFGDNVFMMATGNIGGDADGTDVEELDSAQKSRFITKQHDMDRHTWLEWAKIVVDGTPNIFAGIQKFLKDRPTLYYPDLKKQGDKDAICGPRTWTALSRYIQVNFGNKETLEDHEIKDLSIQAPSYIGATAGEFVQYLTDTRRLFLKDVLAGKVTDYTGIYRENRTEVIGELKAADISKLKENELGYVIKFLETTDADVVSGYLFDWMGSFSGEDKSFTKSKNNVALVKKFRHLINENAIKANSTETTTKTPTKK